MRKFKIYRQPNTMDCGPTCIMMVAAYYGKYIELEELRKKAGFGKDGVSLLGISEAAESVGFRTMSVSITFSQLLTDVNLPAILHWNQNHFVVITPSSTKRKIVIADPAKGLMTYSADEFCKSWISSKTENRDHVGIVLMLEPTFRLTDNIESNTGDNREGLRWKALFNYAIRYKRYLFQIGISLILGSIIQLIFPFLTQSMVDTGVNTRNLSYISIILAAQLMLFFGRTVNEFIRSRLLLYISSRINLSILSDFWIKLMKLPISYFDTKHAGDILQRLGDHRRIESFLTGTTLSTIFSLFTLAIFSVVLLQYNSSIFLVFAIGSVLYFFWIRLFLKLRKKYDYQRFDISSQENGLTMQLIYGMQEIKLHNAEHLRRWEWERIQAKLFKLMFKSLSLTQYQQVGAFFINEGKNIFITFLVAQLVIEGQLTLGAMLAVQYIIGQMNSPIEQLITFVQSAQDAKISLDRLNEIHQLEEEIPADKSFHDFLPQNKSIEILNLNFTYPGMSEAVLRNLSMSVPEGKTTAIVGTSGSGKTTLLKLLLRFYEEYKGEINIDSVSLKAINPRFWRDQCGCVMQDGFIFSDTIAKNIALGDEIPDYQRLIYACKLANILSFIENLPQGLNTKIGTEGVGISTGQKQRLLIARAVYKNPKYIFFDEATNSLDANNEREIVKNLETVLEGKTVVIVAHRLSTVKNADNIIVLHNGEIVESGTHADLAEKKGRYYELIKSQLELES